MNVSLLLALLLQHSCFAICLCDTDYDSVFEVHCAMDALLLKANCCWYSGGLYKSVYLYSTYAEKYLRELLIDYHVIGSVSVCYENTE